MYVFCFWELHGLSPNFHIHVSVRDLNFPRIGPHILLQQSRQTDPGNIKISHRYMSVGAGRQNIIILFWKIQFHFWEYINVNQTIIWILSGPSSAAWKGTSSHGGAGPGTGTSSDGSRTWNGTSSHGSRTWNGTSSHGSRTRNGNLERDLLYWGRTRQAFRNDRAI
jgi:hypothetical protein